MTAPRNLQEIIDISQPITADIPVWPGDPPPVLEPVTTLTREGVQVSRLILSTHTGTHLDAPSHFVAGGRTIDQVDLTALLGLCRVFEVTTQGRHLTRDDLHMLEIEAGARVLLKTANSHRPSSAVFSNAFTALSPSAADYLCERGVQLVGIDGPSVDVWSANDFPCHKRLLAADVLILENLVLRPVEPGIYGLIAVPLNLVGADGCPVRVLLTPPRLFCAEPV